MTNQLDSTPSASPDSRAILADHTARTILEAFQAYQTEFKKITAKAKRRFEQSDWRGLHEDASTRLELYKNFVTMSVDDNRHYLGVHAMDVDLWTDIKACYMQRIASLGDSELAESFYNSVAMRGVASAGIDPAIDFMGSELPHPASQDEHSVFTTYRKKTTTQALLHDILGSYRFAGGFANLSESAALAASVIDSHLQQSEGGEVAFDSIDLARPIFYRGHSAFLIGRICGQFHQIPLVLALANTDQGVIVDAVMLTENEISILFSFARWYFHVEVERPSALVHFLKSIMPRKPVAELYISLGYDKHGKTELYRDLMRHLATSNDRFEMAQGARGMVMVVFTLPSYHVVFKIIKDKFDYPKTSTRQEVRQRYYLVFKHDRGGRLVDAQEFTHLRFAKSSFAPDLLDELLKVAPSAVSVEGDFVLVKHVYIERKLIPLDVYLREHSDAEAVPLIIDFGQAVKDLAATNIFPGDILLKNFGVTRHGRVVFYDYDELCLLTDCNFRKMPESTEFDDEFGEEPWFSVGEDDVFPEELTRFLGLSSQLKDLFVRAHGELFDADFWVSLQHRYQSGEVLDVLPYKEDARLHYVRSAMRPHDL